MAVLQPFLYPHFNGRGFQPGKEFEILDQAGGFAGEEVTHGADFVGDARAVGIQRQHLHLHIPQDGIGEGVKEFGDDPEVDTRLDVFQLGNADRIRVDEIWCGGRIDGLDDHLRCTVYDDNIRLAERSRRRNGCGGRVAGCEAPAGI